MYSGADAAAILVDRIVNKLTLRSQDSITAEGVGCQVAVETASVQANFALQDSGALAATFRATLRGCGMSRCAPDMVERAIGFGPGRDACLDAIALRVCVAGRVGLANLVARQPLKRFLVTAPWWGSVTCTPDVWYISGCYYIRAGRNVLCMTRATLTPCATLSHTMPTSNAMPSAIVQLTPSSTPTPAGLCDQQSLHAAAPPKPRSKECTAKERPSPGHSCLLSKLAGLDQ